MSHDDSYLTERLAERRRQVRSGMAGIGLLLALGWGLLLSYPAPEGSVPPLATITTITTATTASQSDSLSAGAATALR
jgi:hypothetical protein